MSTNFSAPPRVPAAPNLPIPPIAYSSSYETQLCNVLRIFFTSLIGAINSIVLKSQYEPNGTSIFVAATSVNVVFAIPQTSVNYFVNLSGNAAGYCWVSNKTVNGFVINCSVSNSNSTDWQVTV